MTALEQPANSAVSTVGPNDRYKWVALSNTTIGALLASIDGSIILIAMPDIFRGVRLDPLAPGNSFYLLWMILGYIIVAGVLVVSLGRLGDMFGRVRMYNLGFAVYTLTSLILAIDPLHGRAGAIWLIAWRLAQGVGASFLLANSSAIVTDAFPPNQRGLALGINNIAVISGTLIGLILGGVLAPINWRLIFLISVPLGLFGTVWAYLKLEERGVKKRARVDWAGNAAFAIGLTLLMIGITYGIEPSGGHQMGWSSPRVLSELAGGAACLVAFGVIESRAPHPMFRLPLFKIRAFTAGIFSSFLASVGRGGLMFVLIIWLQGIWLPQHGYSFSETPMWAGIYMVPQSIGFFLVGPVSGYLSDRFGARAFATGGMVIAAVSFVLLLLLPVNFVYWQFGLIMFLNGIGTGAFAAPNRAAVMNSLPAEERGVGSGMNQTSLNCAQVLSIGIFFSLMILGLSTALSGNLTKGLVAHGVAPGVAARVGHLPPVSVLFAAFLGYNPLRTLLGPHVLSGLSPANQAQLTGVTYFPKLISSAFHAGLIAALLFGIVTCLIAAATSWSRGKLPS